MYIGILVAVAIAYYFDAPLLPVLVAAAVLQCFRAYAVTRKQVALRLAIGMVMVGLVQYAGLPLVASVDGPELPIPLAWFEWLTGATAIFTLCAATIIGVLGDSAGPFRRSRLASDPENPSAIDAAIRAESDQLLAKMNANVAERKATQRRYFSFGTSPTVTQDNAAAHDELNRLRREELSLGAHMRRGEQVKSAPGLAIGSVAHRQTRVHSNSIATQSIAERGRPASDDGGFASAFLVGALVGSAIHHDSASCDDRTSSSVGQSTCDTQSDPRSDPDSNNF